MNGAAAVNAGHTVARSRRTWRLAVLFSVVATLLLLATVLRSRLPIGEYYYYLSTPFNRFADSVGGLGHDTPWPVLAALVFGLLGSLAPCQLTSNLAAVSVAGRQVGQPGRVIQTVLAYVAGKVTVYTLIGTAVVLLGFKLDQNPHFVPFVSLVRKAMGPLLIVVGLVMLDVLPFRVSFGGTAAGWIERHRPQGHLLGAYAMGVAFAFAFCPTLFWLFFGLTLPLAVGTAAGVAVPIAFALGTALPVLILGLLITSGGMSISPVIARTRRLDQWLSVVAGILFIVLGINEFVLYWLV